MAHHPRVSKMFGVLVLGGSMLVKPHLITAEPRTQDPNVQPTSKRPEAPIDSHKTSIKTPAETKGKPPLPVKAIPVERPVKERPAEDCQMEFTFYKYSREGVEPLSTCLDNKSEAEIITLIKEAKQQTCHSPFCGCWLG